MSFENTSNYEQYLLYKQLKKTLSVNYKGIELSNVLAWDLLKICVFDYQPQIRDFIFLPFLRLDIGKFKLAFKHNQIVFSSLFDRKDYFELLYKICENLNRSIIISINPHKKSICLNIRAIVYSFKFIYRNSELKYFTKIIRVYLIFRTIYYLNHINDLDREFNGISLVGKKYIPFNSAVGIEALFTQFFKNKAVSTYHIFHGIFGRYKIKIANDIINGENINAESILAYSETQRKDLIKDFGKNPERVVIAGNPKFPYKKISVSTAFKKCIILNGFGFYDNDFIELLKLLNKFGSETEITFDVKPHPSSKILTFTELKDLSYIKFITKKVTLHELLKENKYDFAIAFNTVTYYECMYFDLICLRYGVNENVNFEGFNDKFTDKTSLIQRIEEFKHTRIEIINRQIEQLLIKVLGMGINNYYVLDTI